MPKFISEEIDVRYGEPGVPAAFTWDGREHRVARVIEQYGVLDFQHKWYQRKHRDWLVVATEEGEIYKLYRHRGPGRRYWVLYEQLDKDDAP